ncbi:MAG: peptide chain release factor-like protein [Proteobacteria bacterium]|nr:peptide chain release factor-like protein [Pseudomonadota bacterium]
MYHPENWVQYLKKNEAELVKIARVDFFRGSGRGGQKKNKTSNAVRLVLGDIIVTESSSRSRDTNLLKAVNKLRIGIALDCGKRLQIGKKQVLLPEKLRSYCKKSFIRINKKNKEYPLFLGYLLDVFISQEGDYKKTASFYGVTLSQLRKFIASDSKLIERINQIAIFMQNKTNKEKHQE